MHTCTQSRNGGTPLLRTEAASCHCPASRASNLTRAIVEIGGGGEGGKVSRKAWRALGVVLEGHGIGEVLLHLSV